MIMIDISTIKFSSVDGLVPCIVQDSETRVVLMLAYMNKEAVSKTIASGQVTFFSRSKQRLWTKGETSGNFLSLKNILLDCDNDTLLIEAKPAGPACHTGADTCFNQKNSDSFVYALEKIIQDRKANPVEGSYTNKLLASGINKVAQKVGEEAVELVIEAKDSNRDLFLNEAADLMFHFLLLLTAKGYSLKEVEAVLLDRHSLKK
jgi:phosphoribosyl-AMP cyclohydrolase / phosphoribosyl-ATP pyrophosphohydrolase